MVNVSSLPVNGNALFDLDTHAGIAAVLLAVRVSELSAAEKNELRDLVFLYTNGGKDQSVRISLEQKIAAHGLVPSAPKIVASAAVVKREQPTIGSFRSSPSFSAPTAPLASVSVISSPTSPRPISALEENPVRKAPAAVQSVQATAPTTAEPVYVPPVQLPKADQQQYLDRIREIKALVNEKVGNPVNLVDINNSVGREYMSALLDAMKRINSGMSADTAMQRLEKAYLAVEDTLRNMAVDMPQAADTVLVPTPVTFLPSELSTETTPAPMSYAAPTAYVPVTSVPQPLYQSEPALPQTPKYQIPVEPVGTPAPRYEPAMVPQPVVVIPNYNQPPVVPTIHTPTPHTFSSLADMVQQAHAQTGLPTTPAAAHPLMAGDPLLSLEVESGLDQLLSEWSIFKKSGIFGTGPKGREHPLYKKMSELQIPLLLAGRFEGATQEVRQSLTDYMNGWRYEQGLIYEKGETFEHYLRRVIRHILDQNNR